MSERLKRQPQKERTATLPSFTSPRPSGKRKVAKEKKVRRRRQRKDISVEPSASFDFDGYDKGLYEDLSENNGVERADSETAHLNSYELHDPTYQPRSLPLARTPVRHFDIGSHDLIVTYQTVNLSVPEMMKFGHYTFLRYGSRAIQCMTGRCGGAPTKSFVDPTSLTTHCQTEHASLVCSPYLCLGTIADCHSEPYHTLP
jgi:hypothetical protein